MSNRMSRVVVPVYSASYDGRFYGRYPHGDKPITGADLTGDAVARAAASASLSTAIRPAASSYDVAGASGGLSTRIQLAAGAADIAAAAATLAGDPRHPTYVPDFKSNWGTGTPGNGLDSTGEILFAFTGSIYSNARTGAFGESQCARFQCNTNNNGGDETFGAILYDNPITDGTELWIRSYHYLPSSFCAGSGGQGAGKEPPDPKIKWLRFFSGSARWLTVHMKGFNTDGTCAPSSVGPYIGSWEELTYGQVVDVPNPGNVPVPRDRWVALQWHIRFSSIPEDSFMEAWMDSTYLGKGSTWGPEVPENERINWYPGYTSQFQPIIGDYWNGGSSGNNTWYIGDTIITRHQPNTFDSGGRPYIHPLTRFGDF